jgi:hypothetical protein
VKRAIVIAALLVASNVIAQNPAARVAEDAMVIDRVAEASKRDLPVDLLTRIVNEDIELLRGRRADGSYEYATFERFEAARITNSFSINPRADKMETVELRGSNIYRVIVDVPNRRMVVRRNNPVWVERIDVDFIGEGSTTTQQRSFDVKSWLKPGDVRPIDLPIIARQATAKVIATADPKHGYGNLDIALVQARIVDNANSPYAEAVTSAKAALRALENGQIPALRTAAQRMRDALGGSAATAAFNTPRASSSEMTVTARPASVSENATRLELRTELQIIEDLLTGTESERREGLDKLHQLIRRMRQ